MLYGKVQGESHVPKLKRELEKAQIEWFTLVKERIAWVADTKKARKLEVDLVEMGKAMTQLRSIHQAQLEQKDAFARSRGRKWTRSCRSPIMLCFWQGINCNLKQDIDSVNRRLRRRRREETRAIWVK